MEQEPERIKVSSIAIVKSHIGEAPFPESANTVLVDSSLIDGVDSFCVKEYRIINKYDYEYALIASSTIDAFYLSMVLNGFIFNSITKEKSNIITQKAIKDYYIPLIDLSLQKRVSQIERLIEYLSSIPDLSVPKRLMYFLHDLRDSLCLELYLAKFFSQLGLSLVDEVCKVTETEMDFTNNEVLMSFLNNMAGADSVVRAKMREMNIIMSHYYKNLKDLINKNDLESQ